MEENEEGESSKREEREGKEEEEMHWTGVICNLPKNTPMGDEL